MESVLTEKEVAKIFKLNVTTLQKWRHKKKGPKYFKDGGLIRYRIQDIEKHLENMLVYPERK